MSNYQKRIRFYLDDEMKDAFRDANKNLKLNRASALHLFRLGYQACFMRFRPFLKEFLERSRKKAR